MHETLWSDRLFQETALIIVSFLFAVALVMYLLPMRSPRFVAAKASLRSWLFIVPLLLLLFSLPFPWTLYLIILVCIYGVKTFFKMVGMFHRSWFVWITYLYVILGGVCIYKDWKELFSALPPLYFATVCLVPVIRDSAKHMIQYLALSLMAYLCFGWCLLHMAKFLFMPKGIYIILYIFLLTEIAENASLFTSRFFSNYKIFTQISSRWSVEGLVTSVFITLVLAWGMRHLLPHREVYYWLAAALICSFFGLLGDLLMSTIRRDLGIKTTGVFIIGRGDLLDRLDKLIFVAPAFYYTLGHLDGFLQ